MHKKRTGTGQACSNRRKTADRNDKPSRSGNSKTKGTASRSHTHRSNASITRKSTRRSIAHRSRSCKTGEASSRSHTHRSNASMTRKTTRRSIAHRSRSCKTHKSTRSFKTQPSCSRKARKSAFCSKPHLSCTCKIRNIICCSKPHCFSKRTKPRFPVWPGIGLLPVPVCVPTNGQPPHRSFRLQVQAGMQRADPAHQGFSLGADLGTGACSQHSFGTGVRLCQSGQHGEDQAEGRIRQLLRDGDPAGQYRHFPGCACPTHPCLGTQPRFFHPCGGTVFGHC